MNATRFFRHLLLPRWWAMRAFAAADRAAIARAVAASERLHRGELRVAVEASLPLSDLLPGVSPRERATEMFSRLRVWDTAENSGVLIYLQLIDRRVEIVADRGIDAQVGPAFWNGVCRQMEEAFKAEDFAGGMLFALDTIGDVLREHFPISSANADELPNRPLVL